MNWECSRSVNQARILISPHNTNILDIVIGKSLEPEWYLAAAAGLLFSGFVKTNDGQWILIIFYLCLCKHSRCQRTQSPRCSDDPARLKERGNLNSCDPSVTKTKRTLGQQNECHLNELTKGHLTASQNKTEPKGLNKLASCTVFRTWCLFGKITVKYVWHIAFLDFKCIKKEPAFIDVVNQYLLQSKANAVGSTIPFTAHIFLEASYFPVDTFCPDPTF